MKSGNRIIAIYVIVGSSWILFTDIALTHVIRDPVAIEILSLSKGWIAILITSALLHILIRRHMRVIQASELSVIKLNEDLSRQNSELEATNREFKKWADIFNYTQLGIYVRSGDPATLELINPAFARMHGYTMEELLGKSIADLYTPEEKIKLPRYILTAEEKGFYVHESKHVRKDGTIFPVEIAVNVVRDEKGNVLYRIVNVQDISERKGAEEEIAMLNRELHLKVADLEAAQGDSKEAYKELESFSYAVSHDLRAPLRQMIGFTKLLQGRLEGHPDEIAQQNMAAIVSAGRRMTMLIDDILEFSQLGRKNMLIRNVELEPLVLNVVREIRDDAKGRNIEWKIDKLPDVIGDEAMLRLVLVNLISNAVKFSAARTPAIIEIGHTEDERELIIFVRDNGVGFDMKYVDKLFGIFQRLHTQAEFEGTGVGLTNVQRIITRHGGKTWAEGMADKGATFYFSLPKPKNEYMLRPDRN
jgi:PAS domain S-box-containing protein